MLIFQLRCGNKTFAYEQVVCVYVLVTQLCPILGKPIDYIACQAPLSMEFSSKNTRVGRYSLLQSILPTQGWNPDLLLCMQIIYPLSHQGSFMSRLLQNTT